MDLNPFRPALAIKRRLRTALRRVADRLTQAGTRYPNTNQSVTRFGPLIRPGALSGADGENINGPSLIRVPDWVSNRLGRYYLYFAHHNGQYIRMAYGDQLNGPFVVHTPGTLQLEHCPLLEGHIASPDVHVDAINCQIVMYFHGPSRLLGRQMSYRATSTDGLSFTPQGVELGIFYFRVFSYAGVVYALAKGQLYRSRDAGRTFEPGNVLLGVPGSDRDFNTSGNIRHTAVRVRDHWLEVYFTRQGDVPESILMAEIDLRLPWAYWALGPIVQVLSPTEEWEGAGLPRVRSRAGVAHGPQNAVRDPAIYEEDGQLFLLYAIKGENGIALARVGTPGRSA